MFVYILYYKEKNLIILIWFLSPNYILFGENIIHFFFIFFHVNPSSLFSGHKTLRKYS